MVAGHGPARPEQGNVRGLNSWHVLSKGIGMRIRLVTAALVLGVIAGCGSGTDGASDSASPAAAPADAEATKAAALLQAQAAAAEPACQAVMDAVHGLQNESTPAENRHDAAQVDLEVAGALLDALASPAVEIADLNLAISTYSLAILTENFTASRTYPGMTPDLSGLRQAYDETCVRGAGAAPLTPDV